MTSIISTEICFDISRNISVHPRASKRYVCPCMEIIPIGQGMKVQLHVVAIRASVATAARIRTYYYNKLFLVTAVWYQIVLFMNFRAML